MKITKEVIFVMHTVFSNVLKMTKVKEILRKNIDKVGKMLMCL